MDVSSISSTAAIAAMVRQLQTVNELQTVVMSQMVESRQQLAEMLAVLGIGQHIDTMA